MYALVDCNNFYCSCERVFQPRLAKVPLIVLSNNDGCVIARSNEVKALGIEMGVPFFQLKDTIKKHRIAVRSSNYTLYGDLSYRVMRTLEQFGPEVENYSIDESFLHLDGLQVDLVEYARQIRATVLRDVGIPVSIGIAPTKTLAKVANKLAKRDPTSGGVIALPDHATQTEALRTFAVGDIWGIGHRYAKMLKKHEIHTALDLRGVSLDWIRQQMTVVGLRTVLELRGQPCIPLELEPAINKQIVRSRAFGCPVFSLEELEQAVAMHTSRAAEKLRDQHLAANLLSVFIRTNPFATPDPQYSNSLTIHLPVATDDTTTLIEAALVGLKHIYREKYRYKKCGIMLMDLIDRSQVQGHLFLDYNTSRQEQINTVMDQINHRYGKFCLHHGVMGEKGTQRWAMRRGHCSPSYTTRWSDLPIVKA